jgi:hypothetical protein
MQKRMRDSDLVDLFDKSTDETKLQAFQMWSMTLRQEYWHLTVRSMWRALSPFRFFTEIVRCISRWM